MDVFNSFQEMVAGTGQQGTQSKMKVFDVVVNNAMQFTPPNRTLTPEELAQWNAVVATTTDIDREHSDQEQSADARIRDFQQRKENLKYGIGRQMFDAQREIAQRLGGDATSDTHSLGSGSEPQK